MYLHTHTHTDAHTCRRTHMTHDPNERLEKLFSHGRFVVVPIAAVAEQLSWD